VDAEDGQQAENERQKQASDTAERKVNYKKVIATEILPDFRFAVQSFDDGKHKLLIRQFISFELFPVKRSCHRETDGCTPG
jgi:hypothetical protein